ncbi:YjbE family putative metal transport protein [Bacillus hwajinpoensis]|uniref:YjbE family putative metal transport protein n=1 Tax=Guptibacillus hwajinpoensis TaxID=208199 RepID=A0A845EYC3_9BACL|nr:MULTISPECIES: TerC family protein [Bacillaceae]MYL63527.1 YjbE family putative metal transport protein [Pseudalkalibacillus hwajinpoensis]PFG12698.1 YjbE family integral membrane protein [Bacillus sp. es.036]
MFNLETITQVFFIIGIDIVLGGDNAVVIALACRNLPPSHRSKAIMMGTAIAVGLRIALTIVAVYLLMLPFLLIVGSLFLLYISFKLVIDSEGSENIHSTFSFWGAIRTIVVADLIMGLDNVLAIAGASEGKLPLVVFGLVISIPIIVWGSRMIMHALDHFPILIYIGAGILAFTSAKMLTSAAELKTFFYTYPSLEIATQVAFLLLVIVGGWFVKKLKGNIVYIQ